MKTDDTIRWTDADMIAATVEHWGVEEIDEADCRVIEATYGWDEPCLVVIHMPTGRTSDEAGDGGRWHLDRTAY
jgi:precorrin-4 methylase